MINVLVVSAEPRLLEAVRSNLDSRAHVRAVASGREAQDVLTQESVRLVALDYSVVQQTPIDVLVAIDNMLQKENGIAVLMCRQATTEAVQLRDQLASIQVAIDMGRGRAQFDEKLGSAYNAVAGSMPDQSTDQLVRLEIDLPAPDSGSLIDFSLARLLYTIWQRKETGKLTLNYSSHELVFGFVGGGLLNVPDFSPPNDLLGAFSWSHGQYLFEAADVKGATVPVIDIIAEGCRDHIRQRMITETMTPLMRRYPVATNLWAERADHLEDYDVLVRVMGSLDGQTNWESALSALGQQVADGFRAAYFAIQLDLAHTAPDAGLEGATINYSREVRRARQIVDQAEVEKTKAFQAASGGAGRSQLERELGVQLGKMRAMGAHEVFGVWEGCGRKVVQDRFYVLVKEHHPDVYGGNTTGNVRSMAQDIFILVKDSYQQLLTVEKEQTVAPPNAAAEKPSPGRTPQPTPRLSAADAAPEAEEAGEAKVDVKSKMSQLSGFRKKQRHRERLRSFQGRDSEPGEEPSSQEVPVPEPEPEPEPEVDPEEEAKAERQAKLDHLLRRAHSAGHPDANPARDYWDKGFHAYKEGHNREALGFFEKAFEYQPEDGPTQTFYAYLRFLNDPAWAADAEELLRKALQGGNRQSAPDACLFLAHVIKAQKREDEALTFYRRALRLNPSSREAERAVRLAEMRDHERKPSDAGGLLKNLFKK